MPLDVDPRSTSVSRWSGLARALAILALAGACRRAPAQASAGPQALETAAPPGTAAQAYPKFDAHLHIGPGGVPRARALLAPAGIVGGVNLSGGSTPEVLTQQLAAAATFGGPLLVFANLDFRGAFTPGWTERQVAWLRQAKQLGARGLKIFKFFGLQVHDLAGRRVAVDDPRLDPIFEEAGRLGLPVAIHVGDPKAFFEPLLLPDGTRNPRFDELSLNPDWSFADRARYPAWETLFGEFERLVAKHPATTFIGVHFGNDPEEPARVAALLDRDPNLYIDTAARVPEIGRLDPATLRAIFIAHRTRILFGTDVGVSADQVTLGCPEPYTETAATTARFFDAHWEFFETADRAMAHPSPVQGRWTVNGIALPRGVLEDLYHQNAERLFGLPPLGTATPPRR